MPCTRCEQGQYIIEGEGRKVCLQCGHDPLQQFFRENRLPYLENGIEYPVGKMGENGHLTAGGRIREV